MVMVIMVIMVIVMMVIVKVMVMMMMKMITVTMHDNCAMHDSIWVIIEGQMDNGLDYLVMV